MGIVRLAKSLRSLNSISEFDDRQKDISNKISGNMVYMDFVSIVYRIQEKISLEINYLLFSFLLIRDSIINDDVLFSDYFLDMVKKYINFTDVNQSIIDQLFSIKRNPKLNKIDIKKSILGSVTQSVIDGFLKKLEQKDVINEAVYQDVVFFIIDMLTQKVSGVEHVVIAFDGIPSYAKVQEQRQRRYMRHVEAGFKKSIMKSKKDSMYNVKENKLLKVREEYDQLSITVNVRLAIDYVYNKYHSDDLQNSISDGILKYTRSNILKRNHKKLSVSLESSDSDVSSDIDSEISEIREPVIEVIDRPYGEGEKILMDRLIHDFSKHKNNKSYIFYSPDGDSVILCLYIYVLTKAKYLNVIKTYHLEPSARHNNQSQYVNIPVLYDNICGFVEKYSDIKLSETRDRDAVAQDYIFMINFYGNDFIHQIPSIEISMTTLNLMYVYSKFLRKQSKESYQEKYLTKKQDNRVHINYDNLTPFLKLLASYEQCFMLDSYLVDINRRGAIINFFGEIFPHSYLLDYLGVIEKLKRQMYDHIINDPQNKTLQNIKSMITGISDTLDNDKMVTITGIPYSRIFQKSEVRNISAYASTILTDPEYLLEQNPKYFYSVRPRRNRVDDDVIHIVSRIEKDMVMNQSLADEAQVRNSNDKQIKSFAFDYETIRSNIPHEQMPITVKDIQMFLMEWKSGKWMDVLNSSPYEIGYDWRKRKIRTVKKEIKRYTSDVLKLDNKSVDRMIQSYLKTLSWMVDYYMNTDLEINQNLISTWSYNYERSPLITQIYSYLKTMDPKGIKSLIKDCYKKSLVNTNDYLKEPLHKFYIYPHDESTIAKIPKKYLKAFPNMDHYINKTLKAFNSDPIPRNYKPLFDCRMCAFFSKCIFNNEPLAFDELVTLNIDNIVGYDNNGSDSRKKKMIVKKKDKDEAKTRSDTDSDSIDNAVMSRYIFRHGIQNTFKPKYDRNMFISSKNINLRIKKGSKKKTIVNLVKKGQ